MSRQWTWFRAHVGVEVVDILVLAAIALTWQNGVALLERLQLGDRTVTIESLRDVDSTIALLTKLLLVLALARFATLVGWLYACVRLIADEHLGTLRHAPGWAIGAWFVPFLNLVRVPAIFMDVQAAGESDSHLVKSRATVVWWWLGYLVLSVASGVSTLLVGGTGIARIRGRALAATVNTAFQLTIAVITILLMLALTRALERRLRMVGAERAQLADYPPPAADSLETATYASFPAASGSSATPPSVAPPPAPAPQGFEPPAPVAAGATADPRERVRILSDQEKAALADVAPPSSDADWYDDPLHADGRRFWNGTQWTGRAVAPPGG